MSADYLHDRSIEEIVAEMEAAERAAATAFPIEIIDYTKIHATGDEIVEGILHRGRWTAVAAGPKQGKTTLLMFTTVEVSEGRDPYDGTPCDAITVLYLDGEMGRLDLEQRLRELGHDPSDPAALPRWKSCDVIPRLDTLEGGARIVRAVEMLGAQVVVIDGINGAVTGAEKDDTTWRAFYDFTIMPLKRMGVAVVTGDNLGKDTSLGPRGSSVKQDKPDAVLELKRTDGGVKIITKLRRTSAYPPEWHLSIDGINGDDAVTYRRVATTWPHGTAEAAKVLDDLGVPVNVGRTKAREALDAARAASADDNAYRFRNEVLTAAVRYRKLRAGGGR